MAGQGRISGTAVAAASGGSLLLYAALTGRTPLAALKDVLSGNPTGVPAATAYVSTGVPGGTYGSGYIGPITPTTGKASALVQVARQQIGKPYSWGAAGPDKFDCSGLVSYCLRQIGVFSPTQRFVTGQFLVWNGAVTVSRPPQAGDLICWTGHVAIATSDTMMIAAPGMGRKVQEQRIYWTGSPLVRRLK